MTFQVARPQQYDQVIALYAAVIEQLACDGIRIWWDLDTYPSRAYFARALEREQLYVAMDEGNIVGAVVLDQSARPEYAEVVWQCDVPTDEQMIMHVLAVSPAARGRGVARFILEQMKQLCRESGRKAIRLDALLCNTPACALYRRAGFTPVARQNIHIPDVGDEAFEMFEYVIAQKEPATENG